LEERRDAPTELPSRDWLVAQIHNLQNWLANDPTELAEVFRAFTGGRIEMKAVIPPGRKRGYYEARFRGNVLAVIAKRLQNAGDEESRRSARLLQQVCRNQTFAHTAVVAVKPVSRAERLAPKVRDLRARGLSWKTIRHRLRCGYKMAVRAAMP
jgi:hypothetical protein